MRLPSLHLKRYLYFSVTGTADLTKTITESYDYISLTQGRRLTIQLYIYYHYRLRLYSQEQ
jgi:hypothetical protein